MGNFDGTRWSSSILKMDLTTWLSLLLAVITLGTPASSSEPRVVCYYTNWSVYRPGTARFNPQNINPYLCTHLIYAFGGFTKDNTLKPFDKYQDIEKGGYAKFTGLKTYNKQLKTMLAIGGWNEGSSRFSPMVGARDRRKEFVRNAIKFLRQNRFDGLDLDWEYPAFRDGGKPKDRENYAKLVKELREEFEKEAQKTGKPRLLLTMAVPAGIEYIQKGFDVKTLNQYLDWMNLLSYDYHSAFEPAVNHHAPLYPLEEPNEYSVDNELNIDYTIKFYVDSGADRDKLVLGIPTYGRSYTLFNADAVEIGSPADGPGDQGDATREKGYLAYYEICEALKPKSKKRQISSDEDSEEYSDEEEEEQPWTVMHPNPEAMGPVAFRGNQWVGYDDVDIVKKKAEYVAENGLGGIMFWSIDNDDFRGTCHGKPYPLIEAAKEAYFQTLGSTDNAITDKSSSTTSRPSSNRRKNRPKPKSTTTTSTTTPKPASKSNKRKSALTSTTPSWKIITPEPPTTPDPGSDFKCTDEGFYPHPRDCKKYFWCLDSGPSNLGIVANQFTCPSGLYFNKAADSCDFARNVPCKKDAPTTKEPVTKPTTTSTTITTTTTTTTTTRKPIKLSTKSSSLFRTTTSSTTPVPESEEEEEEYEEDVPEDSDNVDAEDPKVIKELIDLIKKVGGIEQLEKQLFGDTSASTNGGITTTPSSFNKILYQKVLERTRGKNKYPGKGGNSIIEALNSRRGPQNAGLEPSSDKDKLLRKDRPQYTTINRQRLPTSTTPQAESEELPEESEVEERPVFKSRSKVVEASVATTTKPLQYVNIRRGRPTSATSDTADDTASRNALFERQEPYGSATESPNSLDILSARKENTPEYVTIRRQRPTTEETTTSRYQENSDEEVELQETALEREISTQPQYTSIVRTRSTTSRPVEETSSSDPIYRTRSTLPDDEPSSPEPTTVLSVQISSLLNVPNSSDLESPEIETPVSTSEAEPTTTSRRPTTTTTTTTTTGAPSLPPRRTVIRRRGSTTTTVSPIAASSSTTQQVNLPKRNFLRRTKATSPPDTTEPETATDNTETTTSKFPKRGGSKFNPRKELPEKKESAEKNQFENRTRQPSLSGARRSERPTRKFVRKRPGGANVTGVSSTLAPSASTVSAAARRPGLFNRRKPVPTIYTTTTTTTPLPTTALPTTTAASQGTTVAFEDEESLQDIGDTDAIEDPSLEPRGPKPTIKTQRRPLVSLKDPVNDQNPSATNEEERTRQSKKFSATINQNQLEDLIKLKSSSQEETTTERRTTADDITAETALAIAAHQLITAPIPSVEELSDDGTPKRTQTTGGYQYTNRQYNDFTDSKTPAYDEYQSTPIYRSTIGQSYDTTAYRIPTEYDSPKITTVDFDVPKTTTRFETTPIYKIDYQTTSGDSYSTDFDRPKISTTTYNIPKSYSDFSTNQDYIRTTTGKDYGFSTDFYSPNTYLPKSPTTYPNTNNFRSTLDDTYSEIPPEYNTRIPTEYNTKIPTEYNTRIPTEYNTRIPTEYNSRIPEYNSRIPTAFTARSPSTNYLRTTGNTYPETDAATEFTSRTYVPRYSTTQEEYQTTLSVETTETSPRISTTLVPKSTQGRFVERTTAGYSDTPTDIDSAKITTDFVPRSTVSRGRSRYDGKDLKNELETPNVIPAGISVNRGSQRARGEKIPIPVESGYSTVGYSSASQDPAQFTREYLLESPVTKTYDDEYQYLSPTSTTPTTPITKPTRKVFRKKIQRKISTTQRPTTRLPLVTEPATSPTPIATTPKSRRVPSKKPFEKVPKAESGRTYRPIDNYDYYDDPQERVVGRYAEGTKVILHGQGHIECLDIGNFPHPTSCKKFISCARMERGALLGWEYVCPKGLSFDPVGGICNWSAGLGCEEKDS